MVQIENKKRRVLHGRLQNAEIVKAKIIGKADHELLGNGFESDVFEDEKEGLDLSKLEIPEDKFWKLKAIFSNEKIEQAKEKYTTNKEIAFHLLQESNLIYYVNATETYLFADKSKLYEQKYGTLKPIKLFDAFLKFGLDNIEESGEKSYVRL